ncbi:MAG TPA: SdiA-regulated domain-containing protein [Flavisolibacter sp.]|jgi:uncharacterized protein YjiK|nr:SdiA-regulated domain-containing protein [Flavisolibacter sp.]
MRFGLLVIVVILIGGFIFWRDITGVVKGTKTTGTEATIIETKKESAENEAWAGGVKVAQKWDMPAVLKEISGIAYMDNERFACIQDEKGVIYIYNHASGKVEKEIPFASPGDFEDIALVEGTAWVVRADGKLFEVDMNSGKAKQHSTPLTEAHNIEGLAYDQANNRLLLAIKDEEPGGAAYKGIYGFNLSGKTLAREPVFRIDLEHEVFASGKGKKGKAIKPAAIGIHPSTGDIYVTDGPKSRLLIMDSKGSIKELVQLGKAFEQPEGLTFSPEGDLYIANEGNKGAGNILAVTLP